MKHTQKKIFKSKVTQANMLQDGIGKIAKEILTANLEAERRKIAAEIYTILLAEVNMQYAKVESLDNKLSVLKNKYQRELTLKQNVGTTTHVFEYDVSIRDRYMMEFLPDENFYNGYFDFLGTTSFLDVDVDEELDRGILNYCNSLSQANEYRNKLIIDVIEGLPVEEYAQLKMIVSEKSSRLLRLDDRGQVSETRGMLPTAMMVQNYLISLYKKNNTTKTRLESDKNLLPAIQKDFIFSEFDSMKQKIIFYRSDMAIIPYCIGAFDECTIEREYNILLRDAMSTGTTSFNPHFDKQIFDDMRRIDFKLKPEMQNEAEFYWVCGHLFGWKDITEAQYIMEKNDRGEAVKIESKNNVSHTKYIRCYKGKYQVWNENGTTIINDDKWVSLGNSTNREKAFNYFKTVVLPELKNTLHDKILNDISTNGKNRYKLLIQSIINDGIEDYIDKIACTDKNSLTYSSKQNAEAECFSKEWHFIERDLLNAIDNFK